MWNRKKKMKMEFMQKFRPTSKIQLLQVCQWYCNGDVKKAQDMFDYYAKNVDLPDFDPVQPTKMQQMKETVGGIFGWIKENQNELAQGYEFVRSIIKNRGALPPLGATNTGTPLPPINE